MSLLYHYLRWQNSYFTVKKMPKNFLRAYIFSSDTLPCTTIFLEEKNSTEIESVEGFLQVFNTTMQTALNKCTDVFAQAVLLFVLWLELEHVPWLSRYCSFSQSVSLQTCARTDCCGTFSCRCPVWNKIVTWCVCNIVKSLR